MKIAFEYPMPVWCNRDPDEWKDIRMFDFSLDTKIHYFENYDSGYEQLVIKVLGFGVRITFKAPS
jgi:hypothetical protein